MLTYACAHRVYPNSIGLKKYMLKERMIRPDKCDVLANGGSNGIDAHRFSSEHFSSDERNELRISLGISNNDFVFFFCGRIAVEKGIEELLIAFEHLQKTHTHIKLLLIGLYEKSHGAIGRNIIDRIEMNKAIIHPGRADDVRPYYAISDVFVLPTYREGFPNAVLEAGSMGLPQIVTDINGCNEIVLDGVNGILIPPKDANTLIDAMEKLINNTELRQSLKSNARETIIQKFQNQVVWEALKLEYDKRLTA